LIKRQIKRPNGSTYATITLTDDGRLGIENLGKGDYTVYLDDKIIEPLIPILQEFSFWRKTIKGKDV
jgi:hypothetical protein